MVIDRYASRSDDVVVDEAGVAFADARNNLRVDIDHVSPATTVATVTGEIDMSNVAMFRGGLDAAFRGPAETVVVVLRGVRFFAGSGLSPLLAVQDNAWKGGQRMVLAEPSRAVRRVLDACELMSSFDVYETVGAALDAVNAPSWQ